LANKQVHPYHVGRERDLVRRLVEFNLHCFSNISYFNFSIAGFGQLYFAHSWI
jgi:hypothetical protein